MYQSRPSRELAVPQYFLYHNGTVLCEHWAHVFAPPQAEKGSRGRGKDIGVGEGNAMVYSSGREERMERQRLRQR